EGQPIEKLLKHQLDEPAAVEQLRPEVPSHVAAVVRKLMAKKIENRYQTPAEVAAVLELLAKPLVKGTPLATPTLPTPTGPPPVVTPPLPKAPSAPALPIPPLPKNPSAP